MGNSHLSKHWGPPQPFALLPGGKLDVADLVYDLQTRDYLDNYYPTSLYIHSGTYDPVSGLADIQLETEEPPKTLIRVQAKSVFEFSQVLKSLRLSVTGPGSVTVMREGEADQTVSIKPSEPLDDGEDARDS